ncbi:MAG: DUF4396 domain-containing protein [Ferruginibacter sp.]|nr:DUF4396 domain-containing protein [Cytophagales bacterium]
MDPHANHGHHQGPSNVHQHSTTPVRDNAEPSPWRLALSATWHCLLGCGLGEVLGMVIGAAWQLDNTTTIVISVILGFTGGFALGIIPLRRAGYAYGRAFKQVLLAEGLSIAVMETVEVLTQVHTPGVMEAGIADARFWLGMLLGLMAGFIAAFPVNYNLVKRGVRHQH